MSEIPEVFAIFEQKLAHVLSFNLRQKGQKKAIEELLVYFSGIVARASKAEARIAELERDFDMLFRAVIAANKQSRKNTQTQTFVYGKGCEE